MKYKTELMEEILTNEMSQRIIDYVSQIYGDSYVGLWLFQAIGEALGPVYDMSAQLRYEANPTTTTRLLSYWEQEYGVEPDPSLTIEQRRAKVISAMRSKGACTPARLAAAVSAALGGAPVEILERTGKNKFTVNIRAVVPSYAPAIAVIERMKPAHLTYSIQAVTQEKASTDVKVGATMTHGVQYKVEVQ